MDQVRISAGAVTRIAVVLFAAAWLCSPVSAQTAASRNVLTIHWSSEDFPTTPVVDAAIRDELTKGSGQSINYYAEYLESDLFPEPAASNALRDYIRQKYRDRPIDLVIANSDPALDFALRSRDELFPRAPIVFSAVDVPDETVQRNAAFMTGVIRIDSFEQTVDLALRLHPSTEHVFVIARSARGDYAAEVGQQFRSFTPRVSVTFIDEPSVAGVLAAVKALPARSVILYIRYSEESGGRILYPDTVARMVAEASPVPVYGTNDSYIGTGVVGGVMRELREGGTHVAQLANRILAGEPPSSMPVTGSHVAPIFDWRQVRRWAIDPNSLPPGSQIRYRLPTVWESYGWDIAGALVLLTLQTMTIAALAVQRTRRRETEARQTAILHAAPDMMFLLTRDGVYIDFHVSDASQLLVEPKRFLGRRMREILPPDIASSFEEAFARLTPGHPPRVIDYHLPLPDGEHHYEARLVPCGGNEVLAVVRDVTESKRVEASLVAAEVELARFSRLTALGELAGSIAHEIRQPLTAIVLNATACLEWLADPAADQAEFRSALLDVVADGKRADQVIRRTSELFKHRTVEREPLDLNVIVQDTVSLAKGRLQVSRVTLTVSLTPELPPVRGDRVQLQQVLLNLIANAVEAMEAVEPGARRITITSRRPTPTSVEIAVADQGMGLNHVDLEKLFRTTYTTKVSGSGIGLRISASIIDAHGGRLWASQNAVRGATFAFVLPEQSQLALPVEPPPMELAAVRQGPDPLCTPPD